MPPPKTALEYRVEAVQQGTGFWLWTIFKGDTAVENDKTGGEISEQKAIDTAADFLYDHVAGWVS